jgi:hypothetical protein
MHNLSHDLIRAEWLCLKVRASEGYAQNLYAAMCNRTFAKLEVIPILKNETWSCSWRSAGGIVADIRGEGDYLNWYCSGMGGMGGYEDDEAQEAEMKRKQYVEESVVTDEIREDLKRIGWIVLDKKDN